MQEYRDNGVVLELTPKTSKLRFIVKIDQVLQFLPLSGEDALPGFVLDLSQILGVGLKIKVRGRIECVVGKRFVVAEAEEAMMALPLMVGLWWQVASGFHHLFI